MFNLPDITVVVTVFLPEGDLGRQRIEAFTQALASWQKYLKYEGNIKIHIVEDGQTAAFLHPAHTVWYRSVITYNGSIRNGGGLGASLNRGYTKAYETSPLVAYFVDDWSLTGEFDLTPWARVLMERDDICMVRLGMPHPNLEGRVEHLEELGWGLVLNRYSFAYGQRPALYHKRMTDWYGLFPEYASAIDCEREYSERFNEMRGPSIMLALPHPWKHIDSVSMSDWNPEKE